GNAGNGIFLNQSSQNVIGGPTRGAGNVTIDGVALADGNVIASNHASGIFVSGNNPNTMSGTTSDTTSQVQNADNNLIAGNLIGLNQAGTQAVPNAVVGIVLSNAKYNTIGLPAAGNVVSGNLLDGILLANDAENNTIQDNLIGTDASGSYRLGNSSDGLL